MAEPATFEFKSMVEFWNLPLSGEEKDMLADTMSEKSNWTPAFLQILGQDPSVNFDGKGEMEVEINNLETSTQRKLLDYASSIVKDKRYATATTECSHGNIFESGKELGDFKEIINDLKIIEENRKKEHPSKKAEKKALARIEKLHRRYIMEDGKKSLLVEKAYGWSAEVLLNWERPLARNTCLNVLKFQWRVWNKTDKPDKDFVLSQLKVLTDRGLILHIAKNIPCNCLQEMYQKAKKKPRTAYCRGCRKEKLFSDMKQCSGCKLQLYCCRDCHLKDWESHKDICRVRAQFTRNMSSDGGNGN